MITHSKISDNTQWIWSPNSDYPENHWVEFRKNIRLESLENAQFMIAVDTSYQLWINGQHVDDACFSDFPEDRYYNTIDVSNYLRIGDNCIAILGYYQGIGTNRYIPGGAKILFELHCNGAPVMQSNSSCKTRTSNAYLSGDIPMVTVQLGPTIEYDASKDDDWKTESYDDKNWENAIELAPAFDHPDCELLPYPLKRFEITTKQASLLTSGLIKDVPEEGTPAKKIYEATLGKKHDLKEGLQDIILPASPEGNYALYDLENQYCGYLKIKLEAVEGTIIDIAHGQHIIDGRVRAYIDGRNFADRYIAHEGTNEWIMPVRKLGGRYLEVHTRNTNSAVHIVSIGLLSVEYPTRKIEGFACSDPFLEEVVRISDHTAKQCMLENYVDTPWREQALYNQDMNLHALFDYYFYGEYDYIEKSMRVLGKSKFCDTYWGMSAPCAADLTIPIYTMSWLVAARDFTLFSGQTKVIEDHIEKVEKFVKDILKQRDKGVLKNDQDKRYWNFYEWTEGLDGAQIIDGKKAVGHDPVEYHSCKTLFFLEALYAYFDICKYLDRSPVVEESVIDEIQKGLNDMLYNPEVGLFESRFPKGEHDAYAELVQALACNFINLRPDQIESIKKHYSMKNSCLVPVSLGMKIYQFKTLDRIFQDNGAKSLEVIRDEWGYMISQGATTFWETLKGDADFDNAGSLCHSWACMPAHYFMDTLIGIKPLEPGFRSFSFNPTFAPIDYIKGVIPTPAGDIKAGWRREGAQIHLDIEYPATLKLVCDLENNPEIILNKSVF